MLRKFKVKDNKYRFIFKRCELKNMTLKFLERQSVLTDNDKQLIYLLLKNSRHLSLGSASRVRNGCVVTGKANFVFRRTRLSRMQMKNLSGDGFIMGARKSSW